MELNDALRGFHLRRPMSGTRCKDLALLRASLDNCESFTRFAHGEYAADHDGSVFKPLRRVLRSSRTSPARIRASPMRNAAPINFKALADGVRVRCADRSKCGCARKRARQAVASAARGSTTQSGRRRSGPLAQLPTRQLENAPCVNSPMISSPNSARSCA